LRRVLLIVCIVATALPGLATAQSPPPSPTPVPIPTPAPQPTPEPAPPPPPPGQQPEPPVDQSPPPSAPPAMPVQPTPPPASQPAEPHPLLPKDTRTDTERRHEAMKVCKAHDPSCDWIATFSSLEQKSVARVLAANGYIPEPEPWGKTIAHVVVINEDVFAEKNWLQFFNIFHYRSRPNRVREELTIEAGEAWDQLRVEESARRLHDPLYSSVVALLPIKTVDPSEVDLLVVTRDLWSLRLNSSYSYQQASLTNLALSLSENNFLGTRDVVAVGFTMDQGAIAIGPTFLDKDLFGQHLNLQVSASEIFTRTADKIFDPATNSLVTDTADPAGIEDAHKLHSEGESGSFSLSRPLWALATEWGAGLSGAYANQVARSFTGVHGDPFELYTDPNSGLPYEFRYRTWSLTANAVRQWGHDYKQSLTVGYTVSDQTPSLLPSFAGIDPATLNQFAADVFPRTELISSPYVTYSIFQPRYEILRNVQTYALAEDLQVGPSASATIQQGLTAFGGDFTFTRPTLTAGWTFAFARDGYVQPSAGASMRFQQDAPSGWNSIDNSADVAIRAATPSFRYFRVVGYTELDTLWHSTQNQYYSIGSDSGLRGYNVAEFRTARDANARRAIAQVELRTIPFSLWVLRAGAVAFYEVGGVGNTLSTVGLYNDVGVGLRLLIPQLNRDVFRIDCAFPLQSALDNPAGEPHVIAGFASYF
jgi:outer membrane protein assembly factor BamA